MEKKQEQKKRKNIFKFNFYHKWSQTKALLKQESKEHPREHKKKYINVPVTQMFLFVCFRPIMPFLRVTKMDFLAL